ncbi:MAG TPA: DUF5695 domain-containing protein, partial [Vicinamibacterales bacterium]
MNRFRIARWLAALALLIPLCGPASADDLANQSFRIQYDRDGIRSLRRTGDTYDTDYIAANTALGRLLVRYRATANGDWRELRDLVARTAGVSGSIEYVLGTLQPTLASKASPSAARGVGGLRGLNDGIVPQPAGGGRGRAGGPGAPALDVPMFTWPTGDPEPGSGGTTPDGTTRWVQYTFPTVEEIGRAEVFWVSPPKSWRILYQDAGQWKPVAPRGNYTVAPGALAAVEFTPIRTNALRIEATMASDAIVSVAEWRVGESATLVEPADLQVKQSFALDGDALNWTVTLTNKGGKPIEIGDLAVPLPFAERAGARGDIYTKKLMRHALVAGHGSWVYWQRSNGEGPFLVMTPTGDTRFEYSENS